MNKEIKYQNSNKRPCRTNKIQYTYPVPLQPFYQTAGPKCSPAATTTCTATSFASSVEVTIVFPHQTGACTFVIVNAKKINSVLRASPKSNPELVKKLSLDHQAKYLCLMTFWKMKPTIPQVR